MTTDDLRTIYKTDREAAEAIGVCESAIAVWRHRGRIPMLQQYRYERVTKGKLRADDDTRSDDEYE